MQTLRQLHQLLLTMEIGVSHLLLSHLLVFSMDDHLMQHWPSSQQLKPIMLYIFAPKAQGNQHFCQHVHRVYRKRLLRTEHMLHHSVLHLVSTALDTFRFSICGPFLLFPHQSFCPCFHRVISCRGPTLLFQVLSTFLVGLNMP